MSDEWIRMTVSEWQEQAIRLYGPLTEDWLFTCPSCGEIQSMQDFLRMGLPLSQVQKYIGYSCIGWFKQARIAPVGFLQPTRGYGCLYRGGHGRNISPITLVISTSPPEERPTFAFSNA